MLIALGRDVHVTAYERINDKGNLFILCNHRIYRYILRNCTWIL